MERDFSDKMEINENITEEEKIIQELRTDESVMGRWPQYNLTGIDNQRAEELKRLLNTVLRFMQKPQYSVDLDINDAQAGDLLHCLRRMEELYVKGTHSVDLTPAETNELNERLKKIEGIIRPPRYSFGEMMQTEELLDELVYIEDLRYRPDYTSGRALLKEFLYSRYNIGETDVITNFPPDRFRIIEAVKSRNQFQTQDRREVKIDMKSVMSNPPQSISKHLSEYMKALKNVNDPYMNAGIFSSVWKDKKQPTEREKFYIPVTRVPEFLLMFLYWDGRDFANSGATVRLASRRYPCSEFSYGLVLRGIQNLMDKIPAGSYNRFYKLATEYACDRIFSHRRLNKLNEYYEYYTGDFFLKTVIYNYDFSYQEILRLKDYIIEAIFKDRDFIISGLQSTFLDFMLPFDIFFRYNCATYRRFTVNSFEDFAAMIADCKRKTMVIWNSERIMKLFSSDFTGDPYNAVKTNNTGDGTVMNHDDSNDTFSISENEKGILNSLKRNTFFNSYYLSENKFMGNFSSAHDNDENPVWDFALIKILLADFETALKHV